MKNRLKNNQGNRHLKERYDLMTYILGARCQNGVVLVADKKGIEGNTSTKMQKIRKIDGYGYIGFSGTEETYNTFELALTQYEFPENIKNKLVLISTLISKINKRFPLDEQIELLYAYYNDKINQWEIKKFNQYGGMSNVHEEQAIGSGRQMGQIFIKTTAKAVREQKKDKIEMMSGIGIIIIRAIEKLGLDENVGMGVTAYLLYDEPKVEIIDTDYKDNEKCLQIADNIIKALTMLLTDGQSNV